MSDFELSAFLPYRLAVLAARVSADFADIYQKKFGLSVPEWRVMAHLSQSGDVSVREIHKRVDMDKSKVSRAAARLQLRGLVAKATPSDDKRLVSLSLTEKGRAMFDEITPLALAYQEKMHAQLTEQERIALMKAIDIFSGSET